MTPERWQEVKQVLAAVLERTPEERTAYLNKACSEPEVRREVESLLRAEGEARSSFLTPPGITAKAELASGARVGAYEIIGRIGAGGMGEIYQARDTNLGRSVAIKVLPSAFLQDDERLARFQREARLLASLNHPNIATIHGVERSDGRQYLVMELIAGETLAERLKAGRLDMPEALDIARQIAAALESAHEQGIVHRDLKPANVKVMPDGRVKVLDFGLAKASANGSGEPTATPVGQSKPGTILGTPAYMSPEQVRGKAVDKRADIWAFGCVLYEMVSGRRAFPGETITDALAAVLTDEPDWSAVPTITPLGIQRLMRRCLEKDPKQRLRDIGEARIAIEKAEKGEDAESIANAAQTPRPPVSRWGSVAAWAFAIGAVLIAVVIGYFWLRPRKNEDVVRFTVLPPESASFSQFTSSLSLSPDGRKLAFITGNKMDANVTLWVRRLDSLTAESFGNQDGAYMPFWSPDSQYIGFFTAGGKLKKLPISGGPVQVLCDSSDVGGATWSRDGVILFSDSQRLYRVSDTGGAPTLVTSPDPSLKEGYYTLPQFLPDGRHFLFFDTTSSSTLGYGMAAFVAVGSIDSPKTQRLFESTSAARYSPPGYLLYVADGTLLAQAFDAARLRVTSEARPVTAGVGLDRVFNYGFPYFSVSQDGVLAYQTAPLGPNSQMTWFDRKGRKLGTVARPDVHLTPALSPDSTKLAVPTGELFRSDIWIYDLKRGTESRLTGHTGDNFNPVWLPDGQSILFSSTRNGHNDIYKQPANGLGNPEKISDSQDPPKAVNDISPDGQYAIYDTAGDAELTELWVLPLGGNRKISAFVSGKGFGARGAQFSPNGRYVAYQSHESGRYEIYVQTFPAAGGKWQISTDAAIEPMWRHDGKELFYLTHDDRVMAVDVNSGPQFQAGIPHELFQTPIVNGLFWRNRYVVSADGQRFLILSPTTNDQTIPITVVLNWPALLAGK